MSQVRASCWSVTINNPTQEDEDLLSKARSQSGWFVEGQLEKGENGTPHYQLRVKTPQVRFSALKKVFPRGHIEVARNSAALANYVTKEETRVSALPEQDNKYPSLTRLWDMIYERFNTGDKDGWDWCDDARPKFYSEDIQKWLTAEPLDWLDSVAGDLIDQGYFIEHHVCNPGVRSAWKRFHKNILFRARDRVEKRKQTDRQTDSVSLADIPFADSDITNAQEVNVQTFSQEDDSSQDNSSSDSPSS